MNDNTDVIAVLHVAGAKVNVHADDGETPLIFCADMDTGDTIKALLGAGAKVDAKDNEGKPL